MASVPVLYEKEVNAIHEKGRRELLKASNPILLENECNEKKEQITAFISIKANSDLKVVSAMHNIEKA